MKNHDGEIVISPIYTSITPVGCYHIPGPSPHCGRNVVGVMTFRKEYIGWYEIIGDNKMKLILECTSDEIRTRQMMT